MYVSAAKITLYIHEGTCLSNPVCFHQEYVTHMHVVAHFSDKIGTL
jgi:hypothetical protein